MEKVKSQLTLTIYSKGGSTWYCDYTFSNNHNYENGTTKAGGYGYDKESTATSNAINHFNYLFKVKNGVKWEKTSMHAEYKNSFIYGVYKDKSISYGIGLSSVINCLKVFSNVKVKNIYYGKFETCIVLEITNTQKQLEKELQKSEKKANKKSTPKYERKSILEKNKKILDFINYHFQGVAKNED